jgi:hypothetical protein
MPEAPASGITHPRPTHFALPRRESFEVVTGIGYTPNEFVFRICFCNIN